MEPAQRFELEYEITRYLDQVDRKQVLDDGERNELFDYFICETESLERSGLSPVEAFTVSKMRFGDAALVGREYETLHPNRVYRSKILYGLFLFFGLVTLASLMHLMTTISLYLVAVFEIPAGYAHWGDLLLKIFGISIILATGFLYFRTRKGLLWKFSWYLPLISLATLVGMEASWIGFFSRRGLQRPELIGQVLLNSNSLLLLGFLGLVALFYVLLIAEKRKSGSFATW